MDIKITFKGQVVATAKDYESVIKYLRAKGIDGVVLALRKGYHFGFVDEPWDLLVGDDDKHHNKHWKSV
jgi:hypothetical protein